jgi:transposase
MKIDLEALLNLPELEITSVEMTDQKLTVFCRSRFGQALCPSCLKKTQQVRRRYRRKVRDLSITGRDVYLELEERQFYCPDCDRYFSERFSFVEPNRTTTTRYEAYLYRRCQKATILDVAVQENLLWDVVQAIFQRRAEGLTSQFDSVRWLGIDEIALRKGHKNYACVLVDLQKGCVVELLRERTLSYLTDYFRQKGEAFLSQIEVFSSDMWDGFINVAETLMPNAVIVVDRFHVMGNLHKALDSFRRYLRRIHKDAAVLKDLRWNLLKHPEDLTQEQKTHLEQAFEFCPQLEQVYQLKEDFRLWYDSFSDPQQADTWLEGWIQQAQGLDNIYLNTFVETLKRWRSKILNFFLYRVTNGIVEGINNVLKLIKRRAFGYLNFDHFRLRALAECG